jgi:thiamine biosynthesis lipoprotein
MVRLASAAMGTRFELVLAAGVRVDLQAAGEAALEEVEIWHRRLSRFASDSLVSHLNRVAGEAPVRLDAETFALFEDALSVWRASNGAFDIGCAPLVDGQGLGPSAVSSAGQWVGSDAIEIDADRWTIRFTERGVSLDLGAIAKGHALDCAAGILRAHGVTSALLHGGTSSVVAVGAPPGDRGWRVALEGEWHEPVVSLCDSAMAMSHARSEASPTGAHHVVDGRDGSAARCAGRVAVVGPSARLADAWATALVVLGRVPDAFPPGYQAFFEGNHTS